MQKKLLLLACLCICVNSFSQEYPFVHYTPKDGLISNQIKTIYQDSKGRLYFTSIKGLSVYDGSRFTNYSSKNGLHFDIINCVIEMGDDSIWILTNSNKIDCLVKGKLKPVNLKDSVVPVINQVAKTDAGVLYAATDQGLFFLKEDRFIKLPLNDTKGRDINRFIFIISAVDEYLLLQRDHSLLPEEKIYLYCYNTKTKQVTDEKENIYSFSKSTDGRIWASTEKNIMSVDTGQLKKGKIVLKQLPESFHSLKDLSGYFIDFDAAGNCWMGDQANVLLKVAADGTITSFTQGSGLNMFYINKVFRDREGITWIATNNAGLNKLVNSHFSFSDNAIQTSLISDISKNEFEDHLLLYSWKNARLTITGDKKQVVYKVHNADKVHRLVETPYGIFGTWNKSIYKMKLKGSTLFPEILNDTTDNFYANNLTDKNGNLIICGSNKLTAIVNGKIICQRKLNYYADYAAVDSRGNIWVVTRASELIMYSTRPGDPVNYLGQKLVFSVSDIYPRSIIIDKNDNIWIGTRSRGILVFSLQQGKLKQKWNLTTGSGLSDDFITYLTCDADNNVWACSATGLDKINVKNGSPVIENLTRQNNIYQSVYKVVIDENNTAWAMASNGLIRITAEKSRPVDYTPSLLISMIRAGKDTITETGNKTILSYKQNNLDFQFAATSFLDEKQLKFSYRLNGGRDIRWSEPSNNSSVSFIGLPPGDYILDVKAIFPAGRYPEQTIHYKFSITPPWWQTWWFRSIAGLLILGLLVIAVRFYYRRKLEKQRVVLEKQQAIEKERTRIATDMHDDLGAGLSRIKFLSETIGIKKDQQQPIEEDINKIKEYSHEMIDKMGEIVWALNEKNDTLSDLLAYTRAYTVEYLSQNGIDCKVETPGSFPSTFINGEFRRNVFLTIKEALHNVVKHARATEVRLTIRINHQLFIQVKDDGTGFKKNDIRSFSNGLTNMESRIKEIGGRIEIIKEGGTVVTLLIPLSR